MSQESTVWTAAPPVCRHLRSKQYYMDLPFHPSGMDSDVEIPCWCFKTMQPFGPDDKIASKSTCTSERECFESDGFG